jgi:hypothetical protein
MDSNFRSLAPVHAGGSTAGARRRRSVACAAILVAFALLPSACTALLAANDPIEISASADGGAAGVDAAANATRGDAASATDEASETGDVSAPTDASVPFDAAGVSLTISPSQVTFPARPSVVPTASVSASPAQLTVTNSGVAASPPLDVTLVGNLDDLHIDSTTCAAPLDPGGSCTVEVSATSIPGGPWSALLEVGSEGVFAYAGVYDPAMPALTFGPSCHDFGAVTQGTVSPEFLFTVTNVSPAVVQAPQIDFPQSGGFAPGPTQTCNTPIEPGGTCTIGIVFESMVECSYDGIRVTFGTSPWTTAYATVYGENGPSSFGTPCDLSCPVTPQGSPGSPGSGGVCDGGLGTPCYDAGSIVMDGGPGMAICVPRTCADFGYDCGANSDGCGGVLDCGTCTAPQYCGGGGYSRCG